MREQRDERARLTLNAVPSSAEDIAAEALRVIRTVAVCFLVPNSAGLCSRDLLRVDPHFPEASAFVPPTEPLPLVPQLERNIVTDLLEAPSSVGLGFIHMAVSRKSALGAAAIAGDRTGSLLYVSHARGAYCIVTGQVSILTDPHSRRRYWKGSWAASFPMLPKTDVTGDAGQTFPWMQDDCILIRLAISEVSVHAMTDGPQRWHCRTVQRQHALNGETAKWSFAT